MPNHCSCGIPIVTQTFPFFCACGQKWTSPTESSQLFETQTKPPPEPVTNKTSHWIKLHRYAPKNQSTWSTHEAALFLKEWRKGIPRTGCSSCVQKFDIILSKLPPTYSSPREFAFRAWQWHDEVSKQIGKHRITWEEAEAIWWGTVENLTTWNDLTNDTIILSQIILEKHPTIRGIAGAPRSGLRVAIEIGIRLGIPVYEASPTKGLTALNSGVRLKDDPIHGPRQKFTGEIVVVEDSTCSGWSVLELRTHPDIKNLPFYAVYGASPGKNSIDGYAVHKELPHWFEWNIWNNGQILRNFKTAIDWDGILNEDCNPENDDDGHRYLKWITSVKPIRTPRSYQVPFIITARREAYRKECEEWLAKYRINYGTLIMYPGTFQERNKTCIGSWKAEMANKHHCHMFIESDSIQAEVITHKAPQARTLCPYYKSNPEKLLG